MKRHKILLFTTIAIAILASLNACKKDDDTGSNQNTDELLYDLAKSTAGFTWYKNSDALLDKSSGSGHGQPLLRTRYNAKAATVLGADGKVIAGSTFPDESLIVKELYNNATTQDLYAVMYKKTGHPDADAEGWVWAYLNVDGSVSISASGKGSGCRGCHGQTDHIDYTLMNKFFQ